MDFEYTDEQVALRDAVAGLLGTTYAAIDGRRAATAQDPGFDEDMWKRLAEMGVLGLPFSEDAGPAEVSVVAREIGRTLAPEPFAEAIVLAGGLLSAAGGDVTGVADGSTLPAYVGSGVTASRVDEGWVLAGVAEPVLNGARADVLVVVADVDGEPAVFTVPGAGLAREGYATYDGGRAARVTFDRTPADLLAQNAGALVDRAVAEAQVAYSHEAVGAMETALAMTTEYLRTRKQFGVPLKSFQALTHRAAEMYVELELATSIALWATLVLQDGGDAVGAASRAKLQVSTAGRKVGKEAVQLHGGIGMTMEYAVGHYLMRLTAIDHVLGDGRHHLARLAARVGDYGVLDPLP